MPTPSIASRFLAQFGTSRLNDATAMAALKWMNDHDPKGLGQMSKDARIVDYLFTDGSRLVLDLKAGSFSSIS